MTTSTAIADKMVLSDMNSQFIRNFVNMDTVAHNEIIHDNFICINGDGTVSNRRKYMEGWANGYNSSGYTSFTHTDELIRIFGNMALVYSRTVYTKNVNGETVHGSSVYTDTYIKENGRWWCVQAQITPVKQ
ncbi:MAG TPA: nuclear transport factor 2 family protein [Chitinophagaceae bacterium]